MKKKLGFLALMFLLICSFPAHAEEWDMNKTQPLPFIAYETSHDQKANNRTLVDVRVLLLGEIVGDKIVPRERSDDLSKEQMAATVVAAAKYYTERTGADIVSITVDAQPTHVAWGTTIANCNYAPDGGGITGDEDWTYQLCYTYPKGASKQNMEINRLWKEMRNDYQVPMGNIPGETITDEDALIKAIAKKVGIKAEDVTLSPFMPVTIPPAFADKIKPVAGQEASLNK